MTTHYLYRYILLVIAVWCVAADALAETTTCYNTVYNAFHHFCPAPGAEIKHDALLLTNRTDTAMVLVSTHQPQQDAYKFLVRFSNNYAKAGGHSPAACGLVFGYENPDHYYSLETTPVDSHPFDEMRNQRTLNVALYQITDGKKSLIRQQAVSCGVNMFKGLNALCVNVSQRSVIVSVGNQHLNQIFQVDLPTAPASNTLGLIVQPKGEMQVERTMLSVSNEEITKTQTLWTKASLDAHFQTSDNPFEGYWEYLDRDMDDAKARLGGKYVVALVSNGKGFDIIYVEGAQVGKSQWKEGMLKGRLSKTIFTDHYNATWIDATFRPMNEDVTGYFESGVILTMAFPVYQSKIRFSKILSTK